VCAGAAFLQAAGNNLGKGLQKAATRHLPQLNLGRSEVRVWICCFSSCFVAGWQRIVSRSCFPASSTQLWQGQKLNLRRSEVRMLLVQCG
jgi:hypothetical protein